MDMDFPFDLPSVSHSAATPLWQGSHFSLENEILPVLQYSSNLSGWNDSLTEACEVVVGEDHPFEKASRHHTLAQIKALAPNAQAILEIGCSSGYLLKELKQNFPKSWIMGADVISLEPIAQRLPNTPLFQFDLTHCPLPDACVDVVVLLNVLEHIEKDAEALLQIKRILKPGGLLILEVPAGPQFYDQFDEFCQHYRRYRSNELASLLTQLGFKIKSQSHLGALLYPAYCVTKLIDRWFKRHLTPQEVFAKNMAAAQSNPLFALIMKIELMLAKKIKYPAGIRCLFSCKT